MELINGKETAQSIVEELTREVAQLDGIKPCVVFIRLGEDPASVFYVKSKQKTAAKIGIESRLNVLPDTTSKEELFAIIDGYNNDPVVNGILVQAPLPSHLDEQEVFNRVDPAKDIDGFSSANLGRLVQEDPAGFVACTPEGIVELLRRSDVSTSGKHVVVIGRSLIVGKPCALLFQRKHAMGNATVTVCHSRTRNLPEVTRSADILIAAIGSPCFVTADMVSEGTVIVDVGINRVPDASRKRGYRIVGDVDFDNVAPKTSKITPVPGGVGPMTIAILMSNTLKAYKQQNNLM